MEGAAELGNYLPLSFKSPKEQEYIEFLWDAFETNYTHGKGEKKSYQESFPQPTSPFRESPVQACERGFSVFLRPCQEPFLSRTSKF